MQQGLRENRHLGVATDARQVGERGDGMSARARMLAGVNTMRDDGRCVRSAERGARFASCSLNRVRDAPVQFAP